MLLFSATLASQYGSFGVFNGMSKNNRLRHFILILKKQLYSTGGFITDAGFCGQKRQELQYYER